MRYSDSVSNCNFIWLGNKFSIRFCKCRFYSVMYCCIVTVLDSVWHLLFSWSDSDPKHKLHKCMKLVISIHLFGAPTIMVIVTLTDICVGSVCSSFSCTTRYICWLILHNYSSIILNCLCCFKPFFFGIGFWAQLTSTIPVIMCCRHYCWTWTDLIMTGINTSPSAI